MSDCLLTRCCWLALIFLAVRTHTQAQVPLYPQIAGTYQVREEYTIRISDLQGTRTLRGTETWQTQIVQVGARFSYYEAAGSGSPLRVKRRGVLIGNDLEINGTTGLETLPFEGSDDVDFGQNYFRATGTVQSGQFVLTGRGALTILGDAEVIQDLKIETKMTFTGTVEPVPVGRVRVAAGSYLWGRVPASGAGVFALGTQTTVTAGWKPGLRFTGWWDVLNGGFVSADPTYTFTVEGSRYLGATYATVGGARYAGLLQSGAQPTYGGLGSWRAALTSGDSYYSAGAFSLVIVVQHEAHRLKGVFDRDWRFLRTIPRGVRSPLEIALELDPVTLRLTGSIVTADASFTSRLQGDPAGYFPTHYPYTGVLPPPAGPPSAAHPAGAGYFASVATPQGTARMAGRLADGTPFAFGGYPLADGNLPVHALPYRGPDSTRGDLFGLIGPGIRLSLSGTLHWIKPPRSTDRSYPAGFSITTKALAAPYRAQPGTLIPVDRVGADNARLEITGGGLFDAQQNAQPIVKLLTLASGRPIRVSGPNLERVQLMWNPATGGFGGTFLHPATGQPVRFLGMSVRHSGLLEMRGYFLGPGSDGEAPGGLITITALP